MSDTTAEPPRRTPTSTSSARQNAPPTPQVNYAPIAVFYILFISHAFAAFYQPIQDCDEVFNYWEPTHYLNHGHGFQTWEYSPVYAIRSWAYAALHALAIQGSKVVPVINEVFGKRAEFYMLRAVLAGICALCEARLFNTVAKCVNARVAWIFVGIMATAPGMFHASVAFLPSSFAMYATVLSTAAFIDRRNGFRTAQGIMFAGFGASLGWPFAVVLAVPFLLEEVFAAVNTDQQAIIDLAWRVLDGTARATGILAIQVLFDATLYRRLTVVPLNIVLYNVFSSSGGPDLYGTEPWSYYLRNLALNFHLWVPLALLSLPMLFVQPSKSAIKTSHLRTLVLVSPLYIWLGLFTLQPHKEERFLYPAYPFLALSGALSLHILLTYLGSPTKTSFIAKTPAFLRLLFVLAFLILTLVLSALRIAGQVSAYAAPLKIYDPLHTPEMRASINTTSSLDTTLCLGKEWYRFPSHHFLPDSFRARFIKSEFDGLLPGDFEQTGKGYGPYAGTWRVPQGMNGGNQWDGGKVVEVEECGWIVDSHVPSTKVTQREPRFIETKAWEQVECVRFLDSASTGLLGRVSWVPEDWGRVWGEYCLLRRAKSV
ncbi:hypothetical protein B0A48_10710 [Cryoendolithus antarcticus]|uniref:Mannosyltransferase n=1 Tax=Cryoendolithus antarcticus TaxID=1507870 RepID=A0A1V8SY34_9PEZI|nr:hypothetical protein B0A48_10710 [Cryoendolithus antarcticus]